MTRFSSVGHEKSYRRHSRLWEILLCLLLLCGALYIRYRKGSDCVPTSTAIAGGKASYALTLSDLADELYKKSGLDGTHQDRDGGKP